MSDEQAHRDARELADLIERQEAEQRRDAEAWQQHVLSIAQLTLEVARELWPPLPPPADPPQPVEPDGQGDDEDQGE